MTLRKSAGGGIPMIIEMRTYKTKPGFRSQFQVMFRSKSIPAHAEIGMKDHNLNIPRYVEAKNTQEVERPIICGGALSCELRFTKANSANVCQDMLRCVGCF